MRKITPAQILCFLALTSIPIATACLAATAAKTHLSPGDFRGIMAVALWLISLYVTTVVVYRVFLHLLPLPAGEIALASREEFIYHIYILFYLMFFYPVMRSGLLPTPLMRLFYLALGTRMGHNTYSMGILHDPPFIEIGADSVVGQSALLIPHVIEGDRLAHYPIRIGNHVTIGANAAILSGVEIGDGAIVATGAVVSKGTRIGCGEVWGGIPARCLRSQNHVSPSSP